MTAFRIVFVFVLVYTYRTDSSSMGFLMLVVIATLIAFNVFAAESMVRLRHDVRDIHKLVSALKTAPPAARVPAAA